jgi:hypothetical protein
LCCGRLNKDIAGDLNTSKKTVSLWQTRFAAIELAPNKLMDGGKIIAECMPQHQHQEWLNVIERWFRDITDQRIRRGVFNSVGQLIAAIMDYIDHHNNDARTFKWTAKAALDKTPTA